MCYKFVLYIGCGHDRSPHYFRPESRTDECLCPTFYRLPPKTGLCYDCDREIKISRGIQVPPDTLTPLNRARNRAWRESVENDVKDGEIKRIAKEGKPGFDQMSGYSGSDSGVTGARYQRDSEPLRPKQSNAKAVDGVIPPYVQQPGETFLEHIIVEILDDAKSGGEATRLLRAWDNEPQGYGNIDANGQESWLVLSQKWIEQYGERMNVWTGEIGPPLGTSSGLQRPVKFIPIGPPTIGNPAIGIPMMPNPRYVAAMQNQEFAPQFGRHNTAPTRWMGYEPQAEMFQKPGPRSKAVKITAPLLPSLPIVPKIPNQFNPTTANIPRHNTAPINRPATTKFPGPPGIPAPPFTLEKYGGHDKMAKGVIEAVKKEGITTLRNEGKENGMFLSKQKTDVHSSSSISATKSKDQGSQNINSQKLASEASTPDGATSEPSGGVKLNQKD
ncbi:hypothetical protein AA313_de0208625 [Arthrobotrys entomopaga]|nr:hypothetical protein AA313_de0208625 [Arthrobotrys entomopaga]